MKTILIIEDHALARDRMHGIMIEAFGDIQISEASTLALARTIIIDNSFDLIVLDLDLPDGKGEDFIPEIYETCETPYVVISTIHDESDRLLAALRNGAKGYLLKEETKEFLINEFKGILDDKPPLAPTITNQLMDFVRNMSHRDDQDRLANKNPRNLQSYNLTERETEILIMMSKGYERPEIAGILDISKHTVATHISKVYSKLEIRSRAEAAIFATQYGLL